MCAFEMCQGNDVFNSGFDGCNTDNINIEVFWNVHLYYIISLFCLIQFFFLWLFSYGFVEIC